MPTSTLFRAGNTCTCHDFRTNRLGICKHISATLKYVSAIRGNKKLIKSDYHQPETFIYLGYKNGRQIRLCIGSEQQAAFANWAKKYFYTEGFIAKGELSLRRKRSRRESCYPIFYPNSIPLFKKVKPFMKRLDARPMPSTLYSNSVKTVGGMASEG